MSDSLIEYLSTRPEAATFLLPIDYAATLNELFARTGTELPQPFKIYLADETQPPALGFPLAETAAIKELDAKLDRWLTEEVAWQVQRNPTAKEKVQLALNAYIGPLVKIAENAMMA